MKNKDRFLKGDVVVIHTPDEKLYGLSVLSWIQAYLLAKCCTIVRTAWSWGSRIPMRVLL